VIPFIKAFDMAVLVTRQNTEHCSNSILEYMACKRPVIATKVGGNPELIINGVSGLLVEPDNPIAVANAIQEVITNPDWSRGMAEAARTKIEREFRIENIAGKFVSLWQDVAST
jgi:glycosyltransferase involved in cell wall biosynthesis